MPRRGSSEIISEEMKIAWQEENEGPSVPEEQYKERFWRRKWYGIGLDTATKEFLAIEFKRTQDARSNYVERATALAQGQYKSLLTGLQAVGQVKGCKVQAQLRGLSRRSTGPTTHQTAGCAGFSGSHLVARREPLPPFHRSPRAL